MKMDKVANSNNDEFYTPPYAIKPIMPYLRPGSTVWCPFDTEDSLYVKMLRSDGHTVIATHISTGEDFFTTPTPSGVDYVVSNPPYSLKTEVLLELFKRGTPFAMLLGVVGLFESQKRFEMFRDNSFEIMYMNRRVSYFKDYEDQKPELNPPFSSVYLCSGVLPRQVMFAEIDKKDLTFGAQSPGLIRDEPQQLAPEVFPAP